MTRIPTESLLEALENVDLQTDGPLEQNIKITLLDQNGVPKDVDIAVVTECLIPYYPGYYEHALLLRNIVTSRVKEIERKHYFALRNARESLASIMRVVNSSSSFAGISRFKKEYNHEEEISLDKDTVVGSPSEKVKLIDLHFLRIFFPEETDSNMLTKYLLLITFMRGLMEELPLLVHQGLKPDRFILKNDSHGRNDKVHVLACAMMRQLNIEPDQEIQINDSILLEASLDSDTAKLQWNDIVNEDTHTPKDTSAIITDLPNMQNHIIKSSRGPKDDKPNDLIASWFHGSDYFEYNPLLISWLWNELIKVLLGSNEIFNDKDFDSTYVK